MIQEVDPEVAPRHVSEEEIEPSEALKPGAEDLPNLEDLITDDTLRKDEPPPPTPQED